jgi:hypothetical protein
MFHLLPQVKKFMVGFEMLAQVQRDLTAEKVPTICMSILYLIPPPHPPRLPLPLGHYPMSITRRQRIDILIINVVVLS